MQIKKILEGGSIELPLDYVILAKEVKSKFPNLPFNIDENILSFNDYIVGELVLRDISVKLQPRNPAFDLNSYFQIVHYLHSTNQNDITGTEFLEGSNVFTLNGLSENFVHLCKKLLQFGLTGSYILHEDQSTKIHGEIDFSKYDPHSIPYKGIPSIYSEYSIDNPQNQLIKAALLKLCLIEGLDVNPEKHQILRDLSLVKEEFFSKGQAKDIFKNCYSPNPWYVNVLDLSIKILFDLELEYSNGTIEWMSFLENTNTLFESYIRKVLIDHLDENISKWEKPHTFAKLKNINKFGEKSYSPDILVNFSENLEKADAVIDVKNKVFEPSHASNLDMVCSTNDLFQLIFYCNMLDSKVGGLIYPSSTSNEPIEIMMDSKTNLKIFLFSVNIKEDFKERNRKLSYEIYNYLLREI